MSLLNELLAQLCDLQRFLRQFSRRGWLRFVTHSAHITEDFEHFEQSIADVFTSHLGTQLPALRGAVRNLALRNMYMDGTHAGGGAQTCGELRLLTVSHCGLVCEQRRHTKA